ncbi:hypothetical protein T265_12630, partial [Opisthorchis viverrini]
MYCTEAATNLVFVRNLSANHVYDILHLSALHKGRLIFRLVRCSRYRSIYSHRKPLTRLLKSVCPKNDETSRGLSKSLRLDRTVRCTKVRLIFHWYDARDIA